MKLTDIHAAVQAIRDQSGDDEGAHAAEDELYINVLAAIAEGARNPRKLAAAALETRQLGFARWYA